MGGNYSLYVSDDEGPGWSGVNANRRETFVMGAAYCLLDHYTSVVGAGEDEQVKALAWCEPDPELGWELMALHPDHRDEFRSRVETFFDANWVNLSAVASAIYERDALTWGRVKRLPWYWLGMLLVQDANRSENGYFEYEWDTVAAMRLSHAATYVGPFRAWCHGSSSRDVYAYLES